MLLRFITLTNHKGGFALKEDVLFKKTPFGGFDRVEVISYIHQLKSTQQKYKVLLDEKEKSNAT